MMYAMEVDPDQAKAEFTAFAKQADVSAGAKDFMSSVGLGGLADQLGDLKLGELLDTPPPGLDEAMAIAKAEIRQFASADGGKGVNDFMDSVGLGAFTQQLADLKLGEL